MRASLLHIVLRRLEPPMETYLHVRSLRSHLSASNLKNLPGRACPQTPLNFCVPPNAHTLVQVLVSRTNAILLPPGLLMWKLFGHMEFLMFTSKL